MPKVNSIIAKIAIFSMVLSLVGAVSPVHAAALTVLSDVMTSQTVSTASSHTITFTLDAATTFSATDTITIDFHEDDSGFTVDGTLDVLDFDLVNAATEETLQVAVCASTDTISVAVDNATGIVTFTACGSYTAEAAGSTIVIEYGTAATSGGAGVNRVTNSADATELIDIVASTDTGSILVPLVDDDTVTITATVDPTITFDIDTGVSDVDCTASTCAGNPGYNVAFGTLSSGTLTTSDGSINSIWIDLGTNASGGAVVTVQGANGGLNSVSTSTTISATGDEPITVGDELFGLCVASVTENAGGPLAINAQYDSGGATANCTTINGGTPSIGEVSISAVEILNTSAEEIDTGRAQILAKASITATTPAASDYTETLTFVATGTF